MNSTNAKSLLEDTSDAVQCQYMAFVLKVQSDVASTVSSIPLFFELTLFRSFTTIVTSARGLYCSPPSGY